MIALAMSCVLQSVLMTPGADSYPEAYKEHHTSGKPLLVLVGAQWCPACNAMKPRLDELRRNGELAEVAFATVDFDQERAIAEQMTRGGPLPQLILWRKSAGRWRKQSLVGLQTQDQVMSFIAPDRPEGANARVATASTP